jgi:hypothetical protein
MERAALTGDGDAVVTLASMYELGDSELGFEEDPTVANCLVAAERVPLATHGRRQDIRFGE